jgi:hypothetical protein
MGSSRWPTVSVTADCRLSRSGSHWCWQLQTQPPSSSLFAQVSFQVIDLNLKKTHFLQARVHCYPPPSLPSTLALPWEMEVEHSFGPSSYHREPSSYHGEPMLIDGPEQGLPFPHVVGKDGQHTLQCIDM